MKKITTFIISSFLLMTARFASADEVTEVAEEEEVITTSTSLFDQFVELFRMEFGPLFDEAEPFFELFNLVAQIIG